MVTVLLNIMPSLKKNVVHNESRITAIYEHKVYKFVFLCRLFLFLKWEILTGAPGALVKESNVESITLELVLSTPQKHKKSYFYFKISFFRFLN
jgi:hypothetical protein